jgi:hypothetical protein
MHGPPPLAVIRLLPGGLLYFMYFSLSLDASQRVERQSHLMSERERPDQTLLYLIYFDVSSTWYPSQILASYLPMASCVRPLIMIYTRQIIHPKMS